jgi:peptidoglycan hydrolase-like protein with peptidoglycan-binding domain
MSDPMVAMSQGFINQVYGDVPGIPEVEVDGQTGWATMYALTRCLQHELGITSLSDSFGPATLAALTSRYPAIDASTVDAHRIVRIIQAALWCKGYDGGGVQLGSNVPSGIYGDGADSSVERLKRNAGVAGVWPGPAMVPKLFKALLTMDAYVEVEGGDGTVRAIQQWMNGSYVRRANFFVIPCDGRFSRDVQKALMLAVQFQIGMTDAQANGVFGPGTQAGLRANTLSVGSTGRWVQLFSAAMVFNQRSGAPFTETFTDDLSWQVREFQDFVKLPVTGLGDFQTWASLLVSTGDPTRRGQAVDCVTTITDARAQTLRAHGYQVVGRYLSNVPNTSLDKRIKPGELQTIAANGLRCFPIYQTFGDSADYFRADQGASDGLRAIDHARFYGFKPGTRIYFAVDFDALDHEVTERVIPHFRGIKTMIDQHGSPYRIGIYGPRNICSRVAAAGLSSASFVSDMSAGYSGNLGYPLPRDWAFDQIATITIGSGAGAIEIDNNIVSGLDWGQNEFDEGDFTEHLDVDFDDALRPALLAEIQQYLESQGIPETGGGPAGPIQLNSTTRSLDITMGLDPFTTGVARTLRMRKALVTVPIFWEIRKIDLGDLARDEGVRIYHTQGDWDPTDELIRRDASTGLGQIFAVSAINARNYTIQQGIITGEMKDPSQDADVWEIWQRLHNDDYFNINTAALVLIHAATDIRLHERDTPVQIPRPTLDYPDEHSRLLLRRYQGFGLEAEADSYIKLGLYRIFESYFAQLRD